MKIRDVIKLIEADGWYLVVTKGSHRQYNCSLANFHPSHVNIQLAPTGIKTQSTDGWQNSIC